MCRRWGACEAMTSYQRVMPRHITSSPELPGTLIRGSIVLGLHQDVLQPAVVRNAADAGTPAGPISPGRHDVEAIRPAVRNGTAGPAGPLKPVPVP